MVHNNHYLPTILRILHVCIRMAYVAFLWPSQNWSFDLSSYSFLLESFLNMDPLL